MNDKSYSRSALSLSLKEMINFKMTDGNLFGMVEFKIHPHAQNASAALFMS